MTKSTILVTGGAGYIGSHAVLALLECGKNVTVLDDLSAGPPVAKFERVNFIEGNVGDGNLVANVIKEHNIGAIIHFAGSIRVDESVREPEKYFKNNAENTQILAEVAKKADVKHFIYSSSAAVYGNPGRVPAREDDPTRPISSPCCTWAPA